MYTSVTLVTELQYIQRLLLSILYCVSCASCSSWYVLVVVLGGVRRCLVPVTGRSQYLEVGYTSVLTLYERYSVIIYCILPWDHRWWHVRSLCGGWYGTGIGGIQYLNIGYTSAVTLCERYGVIIYCILPWDHRWWNVRSLCGGWYGASEGYSGRQCVLRAS